MHGDGPGMPVGEADEEHYFSPTNNSPAAGSGANGSPAAGGTLHSQARLWLSGIKGSGLTAIRQAGTQSGRSMWLWVLQAALLLIHC